MNDCYEVTYSCASGLWKAGSMIDSMLEDLLHGQTFRVLPTRQVTVHLTDYSYRSSVKLLGNRDGRVWFSVSVPRHQFRDQSLASVMIQLWGNILDYKGIRLESLDPCLLANMAPVRNGSKFTFMARGRNPLLGTVLKPTWGVSLDQKVEMASEFVALGGDFVKEDETYAPCATKLIEEHRVIQKSLDRISSPSRGIGIYVPHITGTMRNPQALEELRRQGLRAAMISFLAVGLDTVQQLANGIGVDWLLWGHRVGYESMSKSMSMTALAQLAVAAGLDAVHVGTPLLGRAKSVVSSKAIVRALREAARAVKRDVWPIFTKTTNRTLPELISNFGDKTILLACGELREAGTHRLDRKRVRSWVRAVMTHRTGRSKR